MTRVVICRTTMCGVIYLVPNGRQSRGRHALAYRILEVLLQTGAVLGLGLFASHSLALANSRIVIVWK
jgi:hypothetical protein